MTQEQLDFFTDQTERAVGKGVRRYRNAAVVGYVTLVIGLGFVWGLFQADLSDRRFVATQQRAAIVESGRAVATNACNSRYIDRLALRGLLISSAKISKSEAKKGNVTPAQAKLAEDYYKRALNGLPLLDCRKDANLLTSDPSIPTPYIPPYYPGAIYVPKEHG